MKKVQFNDEVSDEELFEIFKDNFANEEECWETVFEAQQAFLELKRETVLDDIKREREERDNDPWGDSYAA